MAATRLYAVLARAITITITLVYSQHGHAQSGSSDSPVDVNVTLVGAVGEDATLAGRIRSLFPSRSRVDVQNAPHLSAHTVLHPKYPGVVYLWVTFTNGTARVYLATCGVTCEASRFLLREVQLSSGLDELGCETLAQIAHSSSTALWAARQSTSRADFVNELARETVGDHGEANGRSSPIASAVAPHRTIAPDPIHPDWPPPAPPRSRIWKLSTGVQWGTYHSGIEGWLHFPGAFFALSREPSIAFRIAASSLVPTEFQAGPTRVQLHGALFDARLAWSIGMGGALHLRLDGGLAWLADGWRSDPVAPGSTGYSGFDNRPYGVAAVGAAGRFHWLHVGARFDVLIPFQPTSYDVRQGGGKSSVGLSSLVVGVTTELEVPLMAL